jgi:hypothetical protein
MAAAGKAGELEGIRGTWNDLVLAASHAKLGHREAAREFLEKADGWMAANEHGAPLRAFRGEAASLLREKRR